MIPTFNRFSLTTQRHNDQKGGDMGATCSRKMRWLFGVVAVFGLVMAACGDDDTATPDTATPDTATPDTATPDTATPDTATPDTATPDTATPDTATPDTAAPADDTESVQVGIALAAPKDDGAFTQAYHDGLVAAADALGFGTNVVENATDPTAQLNAVLNLAEDNDIVVGVGFEFSAGGTAAAPQFPDTEFVILYGEPGDAPNLHVYAVNQGHAAFLTGAVGARLSKSGKVGFIGGGDIPPTFGSQEGITLGAKHENPDIEVVTAITGSWYDSALAKEIAIAMIADGVDFIYAYLDSATVGVYEAIRDSGEDVKVVTQAVAKCDEAPGIVIGGTQLTTPKFLEAMLKDYVAGALPPFKAYGVEDPEIQRLEMCPGADAELFAYAAELAEQIASGEIELPASVI